jgi:phage terminase large subunit
MFSATSATALYNANYYAKAHVIVNQGGTNSGKTYSILQALFSIACTRKGQVITVVGQDIPNLKSGALRDALRIYSNSPQIMKTVKSYNQSERLFEFTTKSLIEFKSYSDAQDSKSGKRDYLFVNEANGIPFEVYTELALRTRKRIFIDYNPNAGFWVHDHIIGKPGVKLVISDHRHNPFVEENTRQKIESLRETDMELWKVYARGLTGKISGLVLNNWHLCDAIPQGAKLIAAGLDFGYSNDQTGCIEVYKQNGELWVNELLYETGLTNPDISERLTVIGLNKNTPIIADSAEPKSIEELRRLGWNITPARKGADSVKLSIDILRRYRLNITRESVNLRTELSRYKWRTDASGRVLNEPVDRWNHLVDPLRYIALNKLRINNVKLPKSRLPFTPASLSSQFQTTMINDLFKKS